MKLLVVEDDRMLSQLIRRALIEDGFTVETGDRTPSREYVAWMREVPGLSMAVDRLGAYDVTDGAEEPAVVASAVEFLLEGLHLARRLNKDRIPGGTVYHR